MLDWKSDTHLVLAGVDFALAPTDLPAGRATEGALLLRKDRWMVERYVALQSELKPRNVFELGIYEGGSAAMLTLLFRPDRLVAIDLAPTRHPGFQNFIDAHDLHDTVRPYYGVDQADRVRLEEIVGQEFGSEPLDLVIDDASHRLDPTTASFNVLFPRLRAGGLFVLEDWSGRLELDRAITDNLRSDTAKREALARRLEAGDLPAPSQDLSRLVFELVLATSYAENVVAEVMSVKQGWLVVRRGDASLVPGEFDITRCYGSLGGQSLRDRDRP
jgi:predicted O-methyltransferase YrrM